MVRSTVKLVFLAINPFSPITSTEVITSDYVCFVCFNQKNLNPIFFCLNKKSWQKIDFFKNCLLTFENVFLKFFQQHFRFKRKQK